MADRGEQKKGPIVRYGRGGRRKEPRHAQSDHSASHPGSSESASNLGSSDSASNMGSSDSASNYGASNFGPTSGATNYGPSTPATPSPVTPPTRMKIRRSRSYGSSGPRLFIVSIGVLIVIASVAVPVFTVGSSIHIPSIPSFSVTTQPNTPTTTGHPSAPTQPKPPASYLTASGLRAGLAHIARLAHGARVAQVRVAAKSLIANVGLPHGNSKQIVLESTGTFVITEPSTGERLIPLSQVRPIALLRIVAGMHKRFHVPASKIDYIVLSSPSGSPIQWVTFTTAPNHPGYLANLNGSGLRRLPG